MEKIETHFIFHNFFFFENRAIYEIMSKKMVEPEGVTNDVTIWRIRVVGWISKATCTHARAPHTHTQIFNTYCFSTPTVVTWTLLDFVIRPFPVLLVFVKATYFDPRGIELQHGNKFIFTCVVLWVKLVWIYAYMRLIVRTACVTFVRGLEHSCVTQPVPGCAQWGNVIRIAYCNNINKIYDQKFAKKLSGC